MDCLTVATNRTKTGFPPLLIDYQNPAIYFQKYVAGTNRFEWHGSNERRDEWGECPNTEDLSTSQFAVDTWNYNPDTGAGPTNSFFSGQKHYYYDYKVHASCDSTTNFFTDQCAAYRSGLSSWVYDTTNYTTSCDYEVTPDGPATEQTNATTYTFSILDVTNSCAYFQDWGSMECCTNQSCHSWCTNITSPTCLFSNSHYTNIVLSLPYGLVQFSNEVSGAFAALPWPDWTNSTRSAVAQFGGGNVLSVIDPNTGIFSASLSKVKYRVAVRGPKDTKATIEWVERFTPTGGGPVTNRVYTEEVTFTGREQYLTLTQGEQGKVVERPAQNGKIEVLLLTKGGCSGKACGQFGRGELKNNSVDLRIGLGRNNLFESAGYLYVDEESPSTDLFTPLTLRCFANHGTEVLPDANGLRQVRAPQGLADVAAVTNGYAIRFYGGGNFTKVNGFYQVPQGEPDSTWTFGQPGRLDRQSARHPGRRRRDRPERLRVVGRGQRLDPDPGRAAQGNARVANLRGLPHQHLLDQEPGRPRALPGGAQIPAIRRRVGRFIGRGARRGR